MMDKTGKEHLVCTYCDKDALPNTDPPVCKDHIMVKKASPEASTLKELEAQEPAQGDDDGQH